MRLSFTSTCCTLVLLFLSLSYTHSTNAQVVLGEETFDGGGIGFTTSGAFNDGSNDHFQQTNGSNIATVNGPYSFENGTNQFWAAEDVDDNGGPGLNPATLTFSPVDFTGFTDLQVCVDVAAGSFSGDYDATDRLDFTFTTNIDTITRRGLSFRYFDNGDPFNENLHQDLNFDGIGNDGPRITPAAAQFCFPVNVATLGSATSLIVKATVGMNSGNEEIAFDNFQVTGVPVQITNLPPTSSCANPIVVNDPNQPTPNIPSGGYGPIPSSGLLGLTLGFPSGTPATIDLNCLQDDNDVVGDLEIRLASSTVLPGSTYVLENVYDIRDSQGAEALGLVTIQLTAGNQPPNPGAPRVGVELRTSGGASCPDMTTVSAMVGQTFSVGDAITIAGIGVPVPTATEVSDDNDDPSELFVEVKAVSITTASCTTIVAVTYTVFDTNEAESDPRTDTFLVIDDEAPTVTCSEFSMMFDRCPDGLGANTPNGIWIALPASGIVSSAAGGSSIQNVDFGSCVTDNCNAVEYRIASSFSENAVPGCALDIVNRYEFRDDCGNVSPDQVDVRFQIRNTQPVVVSCSNFSETFVGCPDGIGPNTPTGTAVPLTAAGAFTATIGGVFTSTLDLSTCISTSCGDLSSVSLALTNSSVASSIPGCSVTIRNEYQVTDNCGSSGSSSESVVFLGTVALDPSGPSITAPADITLSCTADITDLSVTGNAIASDDCASTTSPRIATGQLFINELHYDNAGGDLGEGVEIAGPAGTDLSGYSLQPYNGNGGSPYNLVSLSGIVPDEGAGFGAIFIPIAGLQNGAPDGIALCGPSGLIEFLSYEGAFVASGGCADGVSSTDIGVSETSGTQVGQSLQRTGMGTNAGDFAWTGPVAASPGSLNAGQSFSTPGGGGGGAGTGNVPTTFTDVSSPGSCNGESVVLRTFLATDGCGNTAVATQEITLVDAEAPVFTTPAGSLDASVDQTAFDTLQTGDCAGELDLLGLVAAIDVAGYPAGSWRLGALPVAMDGCSTGMLSYTAAASLDPSSDQCLALLYVDISATDPCGNESVSPFRITYTITTSSPAVLPASSPITLLTSSGASCLDPLGAVLPGASFAPGASVMVAGTAVSLPDATSIMGCFGSGAMFTVSGVSSSTGADPCTTSLSIMFDFDADCGSVPPVSYTLMIDLVDDTAPVVMAPSAITIACTDDETDLSLTGEATATDNCTPVAAPLVSMGMVWINEFHYDNAGGDINEFVEIAGAAGTDLAGYSLEFVNGSNGTVYRTEMLAGMLPDESNGFGALAFIQPTNGLQNGAPDGIALCGPAGVVEFLSYEGSFTATGGCASGVMSTDVGPEENSGTPVGASIQRIGSGTMAGQFSFVNGNESPGTLNVGQTIPASGPGGPTGGPVATTFTDVVVPGNCPGNFTIQRTFEAVDDCGNIGTGLQVITVEDNTPPVFAEAPTSLNTSVTTIDLAAAGLGSCAVAVDQTALLQNINLALAVGQSDYLGLVTFPTASDDCGAITTVGASATSIQNILGQAPCSATLVVTFTATDECFNSSTFDVEVTITDNEAPVETTSLQTSFTFECDMPFDTTVTGTPIFSDNCGSSLPVMPAVWINEIHYSDSGTDENEFIEIAGTAGVDLSGYTLALYNGNNFSVYATTPLAGVIPDEGNGAGAIDFQYPSNGLQNGPRDGMALVDPAGAVVEFLSYEGVIAAVNGPAFGTLSTDIGVSEGNNADPNESLQRVGGGTMGDNFIFVGPQAASPGFLNGGQAFLGQTVTVSFSESSVPDPTCPNGQVITRTFVADDGCGNTTTVEQTITIIDTQAPEYTFFPADTLIDCASLMGVPTATELGVFADGLGAPVVSDNCSTGLVATFTDVLDATLSCPTIAVFTRTFDAVDDGCGNLLPSRILTVTVVDTTAPVLVGVPDSGDFDCSVGIPATGIVTVEDCDPAVVFTEVDEADVDNEEGLGFPGVNGVVSVTRRTYTATDQCGLSSSTTRVFRVLDLEAPVLVSCPADIGPIVARPDDRASVDYPMPVFTDNCAFTVTPSAVSGSDFPVGINTVTITALDEGGNMTTCSFTIEVVKALNITCTTNRISIDDAGDLTRADINFPFVTSECDICPQGGESLTNLDYLGYFQGHQYYVSEAGNRLSWEEAKDFAFSLGGRLVQIDSEGENRFLQRELPYAEALIGLVAPSGPGSWVWTDDDNATTFRNWAPGAPANTATEVYGILRASDGLHVDVDASQRPYIIEFDCVDFEVIDMPTDSLFAQGLNTVVYAAIDRCGNRDTCDYTFQVNTFDVLYCTPTVDDGRLLAGEAYEITSVAVGAFAKTFDLGDDYYHLRDTVELDEDIATSISLQGATTGVGGESFAAYWRVWVDANRDGDFYDDGELLFEAFGDASAMGDITLPSSLATLSPTRMRVSMNRYSYPEACGTSPFGDTKDFSFKSDVARQPLLALRGTSDDGTINLFTDSEEDGDVAGYLMLRGETEDALSKIDRWTALYRDGEQHTYNYTDGDPLSEAFYQAVALDADGYILRYSNVVRLELPLRRDEITFEVYPNPAQYEVDVVVPTPPTGTVPGKVLLYDALGRNVLEQVWPAGADKVKLRLPALPTATYLLKVAHPEITPTVKRLMIEQKGGVKAVPRA